MTDTMQPRLDYRKVAPGAIEAMLAVERYVRNSGLDARLLELVRLRASQLNGCAYCVDMHTKDARARAKPSSVSTRSRSGKRRLSLPRANARPSPGPKPSLC